MITLLADSVSPWVRYIWEQFSEINGLKTESRILTYAEHDKSLAKGDRDLIIEYALKQRYPSSLFVPRRGFFKTDDYVWLKGDLPVYRDTLEAGGSGYDIFYNAFVHLSRLEEWEKEKTGYLIHSYSGRHPRKDKAIWNIPVVNYLFNDLESKIKTKNAQICFDEQKKAVIEFSHDVDYLSKTMQLRIKYCAFNFYNMAKLFLRLQFKKGLIKLDKAMRFAFSDRDYWHFEQWMDLESKFDIKSVYYIFADSRRVRRFNLKRWLIEPSYDILSNKRLIEECKKLIASGNQIGIHGSHYSASDAELFQEEKKNLESCIGSQVAKGRQHWLQFYERKTPYIYEKGGIQEDSTLGFNDIPGYRAGIASKFNPYDHVNERAFKFKEIPLVIMDSHLYDYSASSPLREDFTWLSNSIKDVKEFKVSVNWHHRAISEDYNWGYPYREIAGMVG
jgi:hypothetical protein